MGASSSILTLDLYISFPEQNPYVDNLKNNFELLNYTILDSSMIIKSLKDLPITNISKYMVDIIDKTKYIFICISPETIRSITQTIEMNELNNNLKLNDDKKIIYLMTDENYTPFTNRELKCIIEENIWFPLYDDETFFETNNKLTTLLLNTIEYN